MERNVKRRRQCGIAPWLANLNTHAGKLARRIKLRGRGRAGHPTFLMLPSNHTAPCLKRSGAFLMEASDASIAGGFSGSDKARALAKTSPQIARKRSFKLFPPPQTKPSPTPSLSSLVLAVASPKKPSAATRANIGEWRLLAGIDVETHGWEGVESVGGVGQYGFYCICPPAKLRARIVSLGWVVGDIGVASPVRKERLVRPDGFRVEEKATRFHGISHERATSEGLPLRQVLSEFLDDLFTVQLAGGRVVAHHLEFDAGIIANEITNAGLGARRAEWEKIVRQGFCTMDPAIGTWLRECAGTPVAPECHRNIMKLPAIVEALRPYRPWPSWVQHVAVDDAHIHFCVYGALVELLRQADAVEAA
jgi:hypothetical protein